MVVSESSRNAELAAAWNAAQRGLRSLARRLRDPEAEIVAGPPPGGHAVTCYAGAGERSPASDKAAASAVKLLDYLPLLSDEAAEIRETARFYLLQSGIMAVSVENATGDRARADLLHSPSRAAWFAVNRNEAASVGLHGETAWKTACRERIVRETVFGGLDVIEPGVVWFVKWLEANGCKTIFSCEGHPEGFYIDALGFPETIGTAMACGMVAEEMNGAFTAGAWRLSLPSPQPTSRAGRDALLEGLSARIAAASVTASPKRCA